MGEDWGAVQKGAALLQVQVLAPLVKGPLSDKSWDKPANEGLGAGDGEPLEVSEWEAMASEVGSPSAAVSTERGHWARQRLGQS